MDPESLAVPTSIGQCLAAAAHALGHLADSNPRLEAELLLAHTLGKGRSHLFAWPEAALTAPQTESFHALIQRRLAGEPVAYLTGYREFWSLRLNVTPATLIPRPETELLVTRALELLPVDTPQQMADLGTGSGAIAIAVASERPLSRITACDKSREALAVAQQNIQQHALLNVATAAGEWFAALPSNSRFDLIASNPPYIAEADPHLAHNGLPWEPLAALAAGPDGLDELRILIRQAQDHLYPGAWLLLEHGYDQAREVRALMLAAGFVAVRTHQDLAGCDRMTEGRAPETGQMAGSAASEKQKTGD